MSFALPKIFKDGQNIKYWIVYWFAVTVLTGGIIFVYVNNLWWDEPGVSLAEFMEGSAAKPYTYRLLLPILVKVIISIVPGTTAKSVASVLIYLSLLGFVISVRYFCSAFWKPSIFTDLMALLAPLAMTPLMFVANHIYDLSVLFFFTLGLAFLAHARLRSFLWLFPFVCLAKETALLLTLVFAVHFYRKIDRRLFYQILTLQILMWNGIRFILKWIFWNNLGGDFEIHLRDWLYAVSIAPVLMFLIYAVAVLLLGLLIIRGWNSSPIFIRQVALFIVPLLSILHLFLGMPLELRVFFEVYPVVFLLSINSVYQILGIELQTLSN